MMILICCHVRASSFSESCDKLESASARREHFYYDASWRLVERRSDESYGSQLGFTHSETAQWVWGSRYIDELVAYMIDGQGALPQNDGFESGELRWALTDRSFSVIGVADDGGDVLERTRYLAYGDSRTGEATDTNVDGDTNTLDSLAVQASFNATMSDLAGASPSYRADADFDQDGVVNSFELLEVLGNFNTSVPSDRLSTEANVVGYAGYVFEPSTGLYCVRFRWYEPGQGRWLKRDPLGYVDGQSQYAYVQSAPSLHIDPSGRSVVIDKIRARAQSAFDCLHESDQDTLRFFFETQDCILDRLDKCIGVCGEGMEDEISEWMNAVVTDFMRPFIQSLWDRCSNRAITDDGWAAFFLDLDTGQFEGRNLAMAALEHIGKSGLWLYNELNLDVDIWNADDFLVLRRHIVAHAMVLNHINGDLARALRLNGVGHDEVWSCIGDVVQGCQNDNTWVFPEHLGAWIGRKGAPDELDVKRIRDAMRERVRRQGRE